MGKSPAKWIKQIFGKKSRSSNSTKKLQGSNDGSVGTSPVISGPVLVTTLNNAFAPSLSVTDCNQPDDVAVPLDLDPKALDLGSNALNNSGDGNEELAAAKIQAAIKGYLALRSYRSLKGIIRLQALVRGYLVRRQAVATLHATWIVVKLQAIIRGRIARKSGIGHEILLKLQQHKIQPATQPVSWKDKISTNAYVRQLLSLPMADGCLHFQYDWKNPNSALSWLERWSASYFWKPLSRPRKTAESRLKARRASYAMETESGRLKRNPQRNSIAERCKSNVSSESEKTARPSKKLFTSAETVHAMRSTLEKSKGSLRKKEGSAVKSFGCTESEGYPRVEAKLDKLSQTSQQNFSMPVSISEVKKGNLLHNANVERQETKLDLVHSIKPSTTEGQVEEIETGPLVDALQLQMPDALVMDKVSKISGKSESTENDVMNSPSLPSYMATTESAKAKLCGQTSPHFGANSANKIRLNSADKSGATRRHSLPSSTNGKLSSQSPRPRRTSVGCGIRSDKYVHSSRDGIDQIVQVEWRS